MMVLIIVCTRGAQTMNESLQTAITHSGLISASVQHPLPCSVTNILKVVEGKSGIYSVVETMLMSQRKPFADVEPEWGVVANQTVWRQSDISNWMV